MPNSMRPEEAENLSDSALRAMNSGKPWRELTQWLRENLGEFGCRFKGEILQAVDEAVDAYVAVDLPINDAVEKFMDKAVASLIKGAAEQIVDHICGNDEDPGGE